MVDATPPIVMSDLGDFKVCGKRNSIPFISAVRAKSSSSKECSEDGFVACNPDASPENIICVKDLAQCGITDIRIFDS